MCDLIVLKVNMPPLTRTAVKSPAYKALVSA